MAFSKRELRQMFEKVRQEAKKRPHIWKQLVGSRAMRADGTLDVKRIWELEMENRQRDQRAQVGKMAEAADQLESGEITDSASKVGKHIILAAACDVKVVRQILKIHDVDL
jgi:hypothetical protein